MAKSKIMCPKCGCPEFSVATDKSNKHYCEKCPHVWIPGLEGLKRTDLLLKQSQDENVALKAEISVLRKRLKAFEEAESLAEEIEEALFD